MNNSIVWYVCLLLLLCVEMLNVNVEAKSDLIEMVYRN